MEKILIIEDDKNLRMGISELLSSEGYDTIESCNGTDALKKTEETIPDLVLSDIMMPGMDGLSVLSRFQSNPVTSAIPFIFITAKVEPNDIRKGMNCGADDYITKPFSHMELMESVRTRLNKKKKYEERINELANNISRSLPHELRTPLVSILGFSSLLIDDFNSIEKDEIFKLLNEIKSSGLRLHNTIEKFLLFAEMSYFSQSKENSSKSLNYVTYITETLFNNIIEEKQEKYKRRDDFYLEITECGVKIYKEHFKFLISELIENSLKFSKPGSIVTIKTNLENSRYNVQIVDYGTGMTAEQIRNIAPFMQHNKNLYQQDGNGLGLIIVKKLLEIYQGNFSIESKPGLFTAVSINLPVSLEKVN